MFYKMSALELELLARDRNKILRQFQEDQTARRKALKPPILVVPIDTSGLICFIRRDDETDLSFQSPTSSKDFTDKDEKPTKLAKLSRFFSRLRSMIHERVNRPAEAKIHDRSIKRHQKRLSSGAATRIPYPGLSEAVIVASGALMASGMAGTSELMDPLLSDIGPLMTLKCDVCVLSEFNQVFRVVDAILESELWPLEDDESEAEREENEDEILEDHSLD